MGWFFGILGVTGVIIALIAAVFFVLNLGADAYLWWWRHFSDTPEQRRRRREERARRRDARRGGSGR